MGVSAKEFFNNLDELVSGGIFGFVLAGFLAWWTLLICPVSCVLWRLGGTQGTWKGWRRFVLPIALCAAVYAKTLSLWSLSILTLALPLHLGYGIPDQYDEGSHIGRFWFKRYWSRVPASQISYTDLQARISIDFCTRATVGALCALLLIPAALTLPTIPPDTGFLAWFVGGFLCVFVYPAVIVLID